MLSFLIRLAFLFALFCLAGAVLKVFLRSLFRPGAVKGASNREVRGTMMKDPVCGTYVDITVAVKEKKGGADVYFCSEDCRRKYVGS